MPSYPVCFMNESFEKQYAVPLLPAVGHHSTGVERWTHYRSWEETIRRTRGIRGWKTHALRSRQER